MYNINLLVGFPAGKSQYNAYLTDLSVGRDFKPDEVLSVPAQVDKLIIQATSLENLCQCFSGWYALSYLSEMKN